MQPMPQLCAPRFEVSRIGLEWWADTRWRSRLLGEGHVIRCVGSTDRTEDMRTLWIRGIGHPSRLRDSYGNSLALLFFAQLALVDGPSTQPSYPTKPTLLYRRAWRLAREVSEPIGFCRAIALGSR